MTLEEKLREEVDWFEMQAINFLAEVWKQRLINTRLKR